LSMNAFANAGTPSDRQQQLDGQTLVTDLRTVEGDSQDWYRKSGLKNSNSGLNGL
jgi:hypothetical protein